jgi:hypothetical protein
MRESLVKLKAATAMLIINIESFIRDHYCAVDYFEMES